MTKIYFVRHAQPIHSWKEDGTRPLSEEGLEDSKKVSAFFEEIPIDVFLSSPCKRSKDTILETALQTGIDIVLEERFKERKVGKNGNRNFELMRKRWADFDFAEEDGENLASVQKRNIEALSEVLSTYQDKNIVIGTHGAALSTIFNHYDSTYHCDSFLRMIDFMPYILRLDF